MDVADGLGQAFRLHMRCFNCRQDIARTIIAPGGEDGPETVEELLESQLLAQQRFICDVCDSSIACVVAITITASAVA